MNQYYVTHVADRAHAAYDMLLKDMLSARVTNLPGMASEILNYSVRFTNPRKLLISADARKFNYRSQISEGLWNMANTDRIDFLTRYNSQITRFVMDQEPGTFDRATWAYGPSISHQFRRVVDELIHDPHSRRARVIVQHTDERGTPPCLSYIQWFIRDEGLHQFTHMRSNDAWRGFPLDIVQFGLMGHILAAELDINLVSITHQADSMHLYRSDLPEAEKYLNWDAQSHNLPLPGLNALSTATRGDVLALVDKFGSRVRFVENGDKREDYEYRRVPGLEGYASLLLGDYHSPFIPQEFIDLKEQGAGIGW